ncbi:unnamed protein product [Chironomus riparius]|uniref:Secreted protein n=1 Tax=Chironomus riparius TaxID=315576 RepID=A0A9N9SAV2_9DIPT|nr:unnamed protein product [Chironomus riparius]
MLKIFFIVILNGFVFSSTDVYTKTDKLRTVHAPNAIDKKSTKSPEDPLENMQTILNLESYTIDNFVMGDEKDFKLLLTNVTFSGAANYKIKKDCIGTRNHTQEATIITPQIKITSSYILQGTIQEKTLTTTGQSLIVLKNYVGRISFSKAMGLSAKILEGKVHRFKLTNLFDDYKILQVAINEKYLQNSTYFMDNINPILNKKVSEIFVRIFNKLTVVNKV